MNDSKEQALDFLTRTAESIAQTFGHSCETLVHDMSKPGHPIIAIFNSHVSGRKIGSTADIFGGDQGANEHPFRFDKDIVNALAVTKSGSKIKSTTINYIGEDYHYALGINFDFTSLGNAMATLEDLVTIGTNLDDEINDCSNTQLEGIFQECMSMVGKSPENMKKPDRIRLIALLMQRNAFSFQKSITYVAEKLNVSRYTVYKYCHEIEEELN